MKWEWPHERTQRPLPRPPAEDTGAASSFGRIWQTFGPLLSLMLLSMLIWSQESVFMTSGNWLNVARQASLTAILGVGMTFVILTGGIDLSVGSMVALSAVSGALMIDKHGWNLWQAVMLMLAVGALAGHDQRIDHHARQDPALHRHARHDADLPGRGLAD